MAGTASALARQPIPPDRHEIHAATVQALCRGLNARHKIHAACVQVMVRADHKSIGGRYTIEETPGAEDTQMIYHDLYFPRCIAYGSTGTPNYVTEKVEVDSGAEQRNQRRAYPRHEYRINMEALPANEVSEIMNLWHVCAGDFIGFMFLDPMDHTSANTSDYLSGEETTPNDQLVASANGSKSEYELYKYYKAGLHERKRRIRYPDLDTLEISVGGFVTTAWEYDRNLCLLRFLRPVPAGTVFPSLSRAANGDITGGNFSALTPGDLVYITGWSNGAYNAPAGGDPARVTFADATTLRVQKFNGTSYSNAVLGPSNVTIWSALPPTGAEIRAGFYFYTPVRFDDGDTMTGEIKAGLRDSVTADFSQIVLREIFE